MPCSDVLRPGIRVYGPYLREDGRKHVILYDGKNRRTMSYPKWLTEQRLGRFLCDHETVDHDDRDYTNDAASNLIVRERVVHAQLDVRRVQRIRGVCVWCGTPVSRHPTVVRAHHKKGCAGPFCSRRCSGLYGAELQNKRTVRLPVQNAVVSCYYYADKPR